MNLLIKSLGVMFLYVPATLMFNVAVKTFGVKGEVVLSAWLFGAAIGTTMMSFWFGNATSQDLIDWKPLVGMAGTAIILVALPNMFYAQIMGQAAATGVNPALPMAIMGATAIPAYLLSPLLARQFPDHFASASFSLVNFVGVTVACIGLGLMLYRPASVG